jgi:hypothetical protein
MSRWGTLIRRIDSPPTERCNRLLRGLLLCLALARAGTSMPTLCSNRGEYTAPVAVARERCRSTCSRRVCAPVFVRSQTLLAAEFSMGGAAVVTPMGAD